MLIHNFISIKRENISDSDFNYDLFNEKNHVDVSDKIICSNIDFIDFKFKQPDVHPTFITHWNGIGDKHQGLDYHGISIILNEDLDSFILVLEKYRKRRCIKKLRTLCIKAKTDQEDIVHFGI